MPMLSSTSHDSRMIWPADSPAPRSVSLACCRKCARQLGRMMAPFRRLSRFSSAKAGPFQVQSRCTEASITACNIGACMRACIVCSHNNRMCRMTDRWYHVCCGAQIRPLTRFSASYAQAAPRPQSNRLHMQSRQAYPQDDAWALYMVCTA